MTKEQYKEIEEKLINKIKLDGETEDIKTLIDLRKNSLIMIDKEVDMKIEVEINNKFKECGLL